jgi:hypothetical protein
MITYVLVELKDDEGIRELQLCQNIVHATSPPEGISMIPHSVSGILRDVIIGRCIKHCGH